MRIARMVVAGVSLLGLGLYYPVMAQGQERPGVGEQPSGTEKTPTIQKATEVIGYTVKNSKSEELGKIEELVIDPQDGRIIYAVLSFGGFLGIGDKLFAIPWNALKQGPEEKVFILEAEKEQLRKAPGFDKSHWPNMSDRAWATEIHRYYGTQPYWETEAGGTSGRQAQGSSRTDRSQTDRSPSYRGQTDRGQSQSRGEAGQVERESVRLPLKFEKGKTYTYVLQPSGTWQESSGRESQTPGASSRGSQEEETGQPRPGQERSAQERQQRTGGTTGQEMKFTFQVKDTSGGETTLLLSCDSSAFKGSQSSQASQGSRGSQGSQGQGGSEKAFTVKVGSDGRVREIMPADSEGGFRSGSRPGASTPGSTGSQGASGMASVPHEIYTHLHLLFGAGLHDQSLQPGQTYTLAMPAHMPSSGREPSTSGRESSGRQSGREPSTSGRESSGRESEREGFGSASQSQSQGMAMTTLRLRFEGKAREGEHEVAKFSLMKGEQSSFGAGRETGRETESRDPQSRERSSESTGQFGGQSEGSSIGEVTFRVQDGLMEKLNVQGNVLFPQKFSSTEKVVCQRRDG